MTTIVLTLSDGVFVAKCDGLQGEASTRGEAIGRLQEAFGAQRRWLNLGDPDVRIVGPDPVVGMAATYVIGSDCYAYTVTDVLSATRIKVTRDRDYGGLHVPAGDGETHTVSRRKDGSWCESKSWRVGRYILGERETRLDPSF